MSLGLLLSNAIKFIHSFIRCVLALILFEAAMCDLYYQYELFTSEIIYVCQIKGEYLLCQLV